MDMSKNSKHQPPCKKCTIKLNELCDYMASKVVNVEMNEMRAMQLLHVRGRVNLYHSLRSNGLPH
jgi:hypothetical protein